MSNVDGKQYPCYGVCMKSTPYVPRSTADRAWCRDGENKEGRPCQHLAVCKKHEGKAESAYTPAESLA